MVFKNTDCACEIRKTLKTEFPNIKFYVRTQKLNYYNSVLVTYDVNNGPSIEDVYNKISKYNSHNFNSMTDSMENINENSEIPQVEFLIVQQHY